MSLNLPRRRWARLAVVLLLLFLGYGTYRAVRPDPNLKKVRQLQAQLASAQARDWTPDERREKGREMRAAVEKLSPAQRQELAAEGRKRFEEQLKRYAQMSRAEKDKYLDEQIDRSERMRQQFAQQRAASGQGGPGPGPGAFGAGPPGGGGNRPPMSDEEREKRRKERLDQTTPEFRALMDMFRKDMENRRRQRGLPTR